MLIDSPNVNAVEIVSGIVTTIVAPVVGWLVRRGSQLVKQVRDLEMRERTRSGELEALKDFHNDSSTRLVRLEDAIVQINKAMERSDQQFHTIMTKLEELPRVTALMESLSITLQAVVPRNEVESRLRATEDRLRMVEQDIRSHKGQG